MCIEHPTEKPAIFNPYLRALEKLSLEMHFNGYFAFSFYFLALPCYFLCNHVKDYLKGRRIVSYHYIIDPQSSVLSILLAEGEAFWRVMWGILAPLVILVGLKDEGVSHFTNLHSYWSGLAAYCW